MSKKISEKALKDHQKFLKKMGVTGKTSKKRKPLQYKSIHKSSKDIYKSIGEDTGYFSVKKEKLELDKSFIIGQAYSKGNIQVLTDKEAKDSQTGKRR